MHPCLRGGGGASPPGWRPSAAGGGTSSRHAPLTHAGLVTRPMLCRAQAGPAPAMAKSKCVHPQRPLSQACKGGQGRLLLAAGCWLLLAARCLGCTHRQHTCVRQWFHSPHRPAHGQGKGCGWFQACARAGQEPPATQPPSPPSAVAHSYADCPRRGRALALGGAAPVPAATAPAMAKSKCVHPQRPLTKACAGKAGGACSGWEGAGATCEASAMVA